MKATLSFLFLSSAIALVSCYPQQPPNGVDIAMSDRVHNGGVFQPHTASQTAGGGNSLKDFGVGSSRQFGTKVWESQNGRHSVGVGGTYGSSFGRHGGQSWRSPPNYSAGAGYRFRF